MNVIVSFLIKPTIILTLCVLVSFVWRRGSASARAAIWSLALLGALVLPIAELALPEFDLPLMSAKQTPPTPLSALSPFPSEHTLGTLSESISSPDVRFGERGTSTLPYDRVTQVLALTWLFGFSAVVVRLLFSVRAARRLSLDSTISDENSTQLLAELRSQMAVRQSVRVGIGKSVLSPVTWGIRASIIVLPEQSVRWSSEVRRAVLIHELAHVKRRDLLLQIVAQGACAFYWFNPLFWYVASRLRSEREQACDDYVLNFGANPSTYAANLLQIARAGIADRVFSAALPMAHRSQLEKRIGAIMAAKRNRKTLSRISEAALLSGIGLLTAAIAVVQLTALPIAAPPRLFLSIPPIETVTRPLPAVEKTASAIAAQTAAPTVQLAFEVASIKPSQSRETTSAMGIAPVGPATGPMGCHGTDRGPQAIPLGRCIFRNVTTGFLISTISILDEKEYQLGQVPGWVTSQGFDIEGKAASPVTQMELGAMLKSLLMDRFKVSFHRETRQVSGFALVVIPKGSKLEKAADQSPQTAKDQNTSIAILDEETGKTGTYSVLSPRRTALLVSTKTSLATLAVFISRFGMGPVVDKTELSGLYAFRLRWQPEGSLVTETIDRVGPTFTTALQEQLGLRLQSEKVPVEYLLIDHIEMPAPN